MCGVMLVMLIRRHTMQKSLGKPKKPKKSKGFHQSLSISPRKTKKTKKTKVFSNHGGQTKCGGAVGEVLKVCENFGFFGFTKGFCKVLP